MYSFGSGVLVGTRTDIANATPINFGLVQEVSIDETATIKELYGQFQRPVAVARGTIKTTGKAKAARISGLAFSNLFYGVTPGAGQLATSFAEASVVPSTAPYTVSPQNSASLVDDGGVVYAASGLPLIKVTNAPGVGQYALTNGIYSFAAADAGKGILVSYTYQIVGIGQKFVVANQLSGTTPTFQAQFYTTFQGQAVTVKFHNCTSNKLTMQTKLEDFTIPEFDFSCFADAAGNIMTWSFAEVS